jgi:hypothetical protein
MSVILCDPCGWSIRVFKLQVPSFLAHDQNLRYTSERKSASPALQSIVAIHNPHEDKTTLSTRAGVIGLSSLRDTRFDGEISSSDRRLDDSGE